MKQLITWLREAFNAIDSDPDAAKVAVMTVTGGLLCQDSNPVAGAAALRYARELLLMASGANESASVCSTEREWRPPSLSRREVPSLKPLTGYLEAAFAQIDEALASAKVYVMTTISCLAGIAGDQTLWRVAMEHARALVQMRDGKLAA